MLFVLDLTAEELASLPRESLENAVVDLLRARRLGHHLVAISRDATAWLAENIDLSQRDRAMLARIGQDYTQVGDLHRRARVYVRLTADDVINLRVQDNRIAVSIRRLANYG